jgi:hypothetical protein
MTNHAPIGPLIGPVLVCFNHEIADRDDVDLDSVHAEIESGNRQLLDELVDQYQNDPLWQQAQIDSIVAKDDSGESKSMQEQLEYQKSVGKLMPSGTAWEYIQVMAQVATGTLISSEVSEIMGGYLETPLTDRLIR